MMVKNQIQQKEYILQFEFNEFRDTSFNKKVVRHKMKRIQRTKHKIGTKEISKISLSVSDDKRSIH